MERCAGEVALVSSFGAGSAALLHMVAAIDRTTPVIFLDTGKNVSRNPRLSRPARGRSRIDRFCATPSLRPALWRCRIRTASFGRATLTCAAWTRKVEPLDEALDGFDAWITGRKRYQADTRRALPMIEAEEAGRTKVNPLAGWREADVARYMAEHALPSHPLAARGFRSIGCAPCTSATGAGEDGRAGRWAGRGKVRVRHSSPARGGGRFGRRSDGRHARALA